MNSMAMEAVSLEDLLVWAEAELVQCEVGTPCTPTAAADEASSRPAVALSPLAPARRSWHDLTFEDDEDGGSAAGLACLWPPVPAFPTLQPQPTLPPLQSDASTACSPLDEYEEAFFAAPKSVDRDLVIEELAEAFVVRYFTGFWYFGSRFSTQRRLALWLGNSAPTADPAALRFCTSMTGVVQIDLQEYVRRNLESKFIFYCDVSACEHEVLVAAYQYVEVIFAPEGLAAVFRRLKEFDGRELKSMELLL